MLTCRVSRPLAESHIEARATPAERRALASALDLPAVLSVEVSLAVSPRREDGVALQGQMTARLRRFCVVTDEPFEQTFQEPVSRCYLPGAGKTEAGEVEVGALDEDEPELLPAEGVDLLELVHETLALGLDPHPRAPDADIAALDYRPEPDETPAGPFAALAGLKPASGG